MMTQSTIHRPSMEASPSPPPPPTLPQAPLVQRYKTVWRVLLISNLALGAYMFAKARRKDAATDGKTAKENSPDQVPATIATPPPEEPLLPPLTENPKVLDPILEDQQRELFTWILEKKRREKPMDPKEKKQIDDEKAILKHFIRAKSIPTL